MYFGALRAQKEINEMGGIDHLKELVQAENDGRAVSLPFVAMVEQSLQSGKMKPQSDQRFNGRYAVVYLDKKKWPCPLIDVCGTPYNSSEAEERQKELAPKEARAALAEKGEKIMPNEEKVFCPLKFTGQNSFAQTPECDKGKCAWWCEYSARCAISTIADSTICQSCFGAKMDLEAQEP